jgi:hypothetical protein
MIDDLNDNQSVYLREGILSGSMGLTLLTKIYDKVETVINEEINKEEENLNRKTRNQMIRDKK